MAVVGVPHTRDGGYPKLAPSPAMIRSAHSTMSVPPPMHQPCTAAMVGLGVYQSFRYVSTNASMARMSVGMSHALPDAADAPIAATDQSSPYPAQKAGPSASSRMT